MNRIAPSSARGAALIGPWRGRSEAIKTSGVRPPEATGPQPDTVSAPSVVPAATLTQADPAPAARAWGALTEVRASTLLVAGSILETVPST